MKFKVDNGPHIKSEDNTSLVMMRVILALTPIICFSVYINSFWAYYNGSAPLLKALHPIFIILVAVLTSIISEALYIKFILKIDGNEFKNSLSNSYAFLPGLFLSLILPTNTPLIIVAIGALFASIVGKMLFGGFGKNIFNPALVGALLIIVCYGNDIISSTPLDNFSNLHFVGSYHDIVGKYGDFSNFFFGTIPGTLGDTSKLLILVALIYLTFTKTLKWRIPVIYISTVFIMTFIIGSINGIGIWYPLFNILSGSLMFGAVFIATDPVTSPITRSGQVIYGISLGILTVIFRFFSLYADGVLTSILIMNMLVISIDKVGAKINFNMKRMIVPLSILIVLLFSLSFFISYIV